ncbi:MAG: hypothetical protein JRI25_03590 [Deltaproteobacteria bacterium]|nr:hypothetical protein [Deltaproteobacteria bacterium]MBW2253661.1 hypothetical protein [Deltaproteobacteria bacterium]
MTLLIALAVLADAPAHAAECDLRSVRPPAETPDAIAAVVSSPEDDAPVRLAVGSLVLARADEVCGAEALVRVVSGNYWYNVGDAPVAMGGDRLCVDPRWLQPVREPWLLAMRPPPDTAPDERVPVGSLLTAPAESPVDCETASLRVGEAEIAVEALAFARPADEGQLLAARRVQEAWTHHFGPLGLEAVPYTDWGFVGLPMVRFSGRDEIRATWAAEDLVTEAQREKAVTSEGPRREDGAPYYLHFLGADPRFADLWARPGTLVVLIALIHGWSDHCVTVLGRSPEVCTVQVGDLAWYNGRRPDPLGHSDHFEGRCVDFRLFRSDGSRYEAYWNQPDDRPGRPDAYDAELTRAFLAFALANAPVLRVYFNDPTVHRDLAGVEPSPGHDDHLHMCFAGE